MPELDIEIVQVIGALLILVAFVLLQAGRVKPNAKSYLILNLLGAVILTTTAILERQPGFILLEGIWALVTVISIVRRKRRA